MSPMVKIENGFAEVEAGSWLMGHRQPVAFFGSAVRHSLKGWGAKDRASLSQVETTGIAKCADATRPFLTHIPCAAPVVAVSGKILVAPFAARRGSQLVRAIPMSAQSALCATELGESWVLMATMSRTCRVVLEEDQTLSVRPEAVVAWTGKAPTGFCPKLSIWNILLPRNPQGLLFTFYGPSIVWIEGSANLPAFKFSSSQAQRRVYGV